MTKKVHLYHINDLHSHFENWPKIRRYLNEKKKSHESSGEDVFLFDIGDFLDRVHPWTEATHGHANISLMNQVPYDAVTIGNNEGIGNSKHILNNLYKDAKFPVVLANLFDIEDKKIPDWVQPFIIKTTKDGIRIGIIGLTSPLYLSYVPNGWQPKESYEVLPQLLNHLRTQTDVIIILSHMGIIEDEHMAEMYEDVDVIIGAHTHHVLPAGRKIEGTLLTGGGKWGKYIGHTTITLHDKAISNLETELIECESLPLEPGDLEEVTSYWEKGIKILEAEEIADMPRTLRTDWEKQTDLVRLGLDAICSYSENEIGMLNSGLFLDDLEVGIVTKETMHHILPHPMRLIVCKMDGRTFKELIWGMEAMRLELRTREVTGMGFRGRIFGELVYKGIRVDNKKRIIYHKEMQVTDDQEISFVTVDHYRYISFFPLIENKADVSLLFPYFLRDVVSLYLEDHFPIS
ncbi:bifunctional metallophosphatase/5'-nucleotidase [Jeotgalibaca sp. A127]|uniref:bifunctional metallophosphatase/5'-nucleotidase n=1 Tax=Jeotgalibaca sp. A127 TaxID=3457324 RepID=UPI003FD33BEB